MAENVKKSEPKKSGLLKKVNTVLGYVLFFGALAIAVGIGLIVCL